MKANTIINKAKFVGSATAGTVVGSTAKCAIITTSIAAPAILGMSLGDKLVKGKWNVKKNTIGFLEGAAVASAVYVGCHTAKTLVCSTVAAITKEEPTAEDLEAEFDDFDGYVAD